MWPLLAYVLLAQLGRDKAYPLSHYPMYKAPPVEGLKFHFVADADGNPLPIARHTGVTPSQVGKQFSRLKTNLIQAEEKRSRRRLSDENPSAEVRALLARFKQEAGSQTLAFLQRQSEQPGRAPLPRQIQLVEVSLGFGDRGFVESKRNVATLPAAQ